VTRVGQIFVILVTCFSLLFLGLAISVFSTQTNWRQKYEEAEQKLKELEKERQRLQAQAQSLSDDLEEAIRKHKEERDQFLDQIKSQQDRYADLFKRYEQARADAVKYQEQAERALAEAEARRQEVMKPDTGLRAQLERVRQQREEAIKKQFEAEQRRIELESRLQVAESQLKQLTQRVSQLRAILESYGMPTEPKEVMAQILANPPDVQGVVTKVDPEGRYVEISIGSDHGLRNGHRLEVFRLKPESRYLGKIVLTEVDPDRSVGRILPEFKRGTIREGDRVASRILTSQ